MAEVSAFRNNALPYPIYGAPYTIVYPMLDADGDLVTGATTPDAEISKNGDTFADCSGESTEIATSSGIYYLSLTGTELTCDVAAIQAKSATAGMKTTVAVLYPRKLPTVHSGTTQGGSGTTIQFDTGASSVDDYYNGMVCIATIDSVVEVRIIGDYTGSTKTATIEGPNWYTASPDADDTFVIKLTDGPASVAKIDRIFAKLLNKETMNRSTGAVNLYAEDDSTQIGSFTFSDDGTTSTRPRMA